MFGNPNLHINTFNLLLVIFVALGTVSTAYGLAIIGSTSGQPNCGSTMTMLYVDFTLTSSVYTYFKLAPQGEPGYAHTTNIIGALNGANSGGVSIQTITYVMS